MRYPPTAHRICLLSDQWSSTSPESSLALNLPPWFSQNGIAVKRPRRSVFILRLSRSDETSLLSAQIKPNIVSESTKRACGETTVGQCKMPILRSKPSPRGLSRKSPLRRRRHCLLLGFGAGKCQSRTSSWRIMWHRLAPKVAETANKVIASGLLNRPDLTTSRSHLVKCVLVVFDALQGDRSETQQKDD